MGLASKEQLLANPGEDRFVRLSAATGLADLGQPTEVLGLTKIFDEATAAGRGREMAFRALANLKHDRPLPFYRPDPARPAVLAPFLGFAVTVERAAGSAARVAGGVAQQAADVVPADSPPRQPGQQRVAVHAEAARGAGLVPVLPF